MVLPSSKIFSLVHIILYVITKIYSKGIQNTWHWVFFLTEIIATSFIEQQICARCFLYHS